MIDEASSIVLRTPSYRCHRDTRECVLKSLLHRDSLSMYDNEAPRFIIPGDQAEDNIVAHLNINPRPIGHLRRWQAR